ncbi:MAG: zinc ribbon domain-containing protein [Sedimentisphaerales bacterium]|nr:zinc ribbon domain-containing protein [Sedimentisphaerales bacterium]
MPTYEYNCENCEHRFEKFQVITAKPLRKCPECGKDSLKRLIGTGAGVIFKGSGFYATDYRSESYKQAAKSETSKKAGEKKETTATPVKSDTKSTSETKKPASNGKSGN